MSGGQKIVKIFVTILILPGIQFLLCVFKFECYAAKKKLLSRCHFMHILSFRKAKNSEEGSTNKNAKSVTDFLYSYLITFRNMYLSARSRPKEVKDI